MARQFDGTNDSLQSAANVNLSAQNIITVSFWAYIDTNEDVDEFMLEHSANSYGAGFLIATNATGTSSKGVVRAGAGGVNKAGTFTRPTAATWHQWIAEFDVTVGSGVQGCKLWVDNSALTLTDTETSATSGNFPTDLLNVFSRNNASLYEAGRMYALAIYSGVLTSGQRTLLQTKFPNAIGNTPLYYWPLEGSASPETGLIGGVNLTVNGATQVANPLTLTAGTGGNYYHSLPGRQ